MAPKQFKPFAKLSNKLNEKMTLTLNKKNYLKLLEQTKIIPQIIETEAEYEEYLAVAESLIAKKDNRTPEETTLFRLLVK